MSYLDNVELYRRQLWRGILRQDIKYPTRLTPSKARMQAKLMKFAKRAGMNYLNLFHDWEKLTDKDFLIGWADKKLKAKMREKNRIHLGRKAPKVRRKVYKNSLLHLALRDIILSKRMMPVDEMIAEELLIEELVQITYCRNGKKGHLSILDANDKYRTIQWQEVPTATEADVLLAWAPLQVIKTHSESAQTTPRPLFRGPRLRPRSMSEGFISESTIESSPSQFSPTYTTPETPAPKE